MHKRSEFIDDLAVLLAGHVAEKLEYGEVTTGASSDLRQATNLSRDLITQYGMSEHLAPRIYGEKEEMVFLGRDFNEKRNYSEKVAEQIDTEIDAFITRAVETAERVINENKPRLDLIVKVLLEKETIEKDEFVELMGVSPAKKEEKK